MTRSRFSRRSFISVLLGVLPGLFVTGRGEIGQARADLKELMVRLEGEALRTSRPRRCSTLACEAAGREMVALYREKDGRRELICHMNASGKAVWDACDGDNTSAQVVRLIHGKYRVTEEQAEADAFAFLHKLKELGAVVW